MQNGVDKTLQIIAALNKGGLVISGRETGKTKALAIIASIDPQARIVYSMQTQLGALARFMAQLGCSEERIQQALVHVTEAEKLFSPAMHKYNVYVDEQAITKYKGHFKGAVTSFQYPIRMIE